MTTAIAVKKDEAAEEIWVLPIPNSSTELALTHYRILGRVKRTQPRNLLLHQAEEEKGKTLHLPLRGVSRGARRGDIHHF